VTVLEVLPNGNLVVSGEKQMAINQGAEFIRFSGVVNPRTITGDNGVLSTQVADAHRIHRQGVYRRSTEHGLAAALLPQCPSVLIPPCFCLRCLSTSQARFWAPRPAFIPAQVVRSFLLACCSRSSWAWAGHAHAERLKNLATFQGVRDNPLVGYGLVVGLDNTGDQTMQTPFTTQSLQNMLSQLGITLPAGKNMQLKNVAAVMVTARCRRSRSRAVSSTWWCRRWVTPRACAAARC
jgi:hypothetical protein